MLGHSVPVVGDGAKYSTFAAAFADIGADSGKTLYVEPGEYCEHSLVVPRGLKILGLDRTLCRLYSTTPYTTVMTLMGLNRVESLTVEAETSWNTSIGLSPAIFLTSDLGSAAPFEIVGCRIGCGTDGIYTAGLIAGTTGTVLVGDCDFFHMNFDMLRLDFAATWGGTVIIEDNRFCQGADYTIPSLAFFVRLITQAGLAVVRNNVMDAYAEPYAADSWIQAVSIQYGSAAGGAWKIQNNNARLRVVGDNAATTYLTGVSMRLGGTAAEYTPSLRMDNNSWELTGTTLTSDLRIYRTADTTAPSNLELCNITLTGARPLYGINTFGGLGVSQPIYPYALPAISVEAPNTFAVVSPSLTTLSWTRADATSGTLSRMTKTPFSGYTYRANDKVLISASGSGNLVAPQTGTITARAAGAGTLSVSGVSSTGNATGVTARILVFDVNCGLGDTATMTVDADMTIHVSGTQRVGQELKLVLTCDGSARTVTFGAGMDMSGTDTQALTASKKTIVRLISDGATFHEQSRLVDVG